MNPREYLIGWLERRKLALSAIPEDPRTREAKLIGSAMGVGFCIGLAFYGVARARFFFAALLVIFAVISGYRVTRLSNFSYRFRGESIIIGKPSDDARSRRAL